MGQIQPSLYHRVEVTLAYSLGDLRSWEPEESFDGSADEIVNKFWERVNLGGRKRNVAADFNHDEQFHPTGPPRKSLLYSFTRFHPMSTTSGIEMGHA